jgi:uncharacterized protein with HEPN domain
MSRNRDISDYIDDIINAIADVADFIHNMSYEKFVADKKTVNAVIRCLEVLGEAAKHIPASFSKNTLIFPGIKWPVCVTSSFTITWGLT